VVDIDVVDDTGVVDEVDEVDDVEEVVEVDTQLLPSAFLVVKPSGQHP